MTVFEHRQSAHCESGVMSGMLHHHGLPVSEPMAFGLSNALSFAYLPIVKIGGMPLIAYRMPPRWIINKLSKRIGARFYSRKFRNERRGMDALNRLLDEGKIVGLQASVFWLPYFPDEMRFHFNGHNLLVYGREGDEYLISDPVFEEPVRCSAADLQRARFAKGALGARGLLYYPRSVPDNIDYAQAIPAAIKANHRIMTGAPLPVIGVRGINYLADNLLKTARKDPKRLPLYLAHIVRMQEEIGTGGAGFRFLYASFLQESSEILSNPGLSDAASALTAAGDTWREFALMAARLSRRGAQERINELAELLRASARHEAAVWKQIDAVGY